MLIPIYKPSGMTSFQVVRAVRNALGKIKVGHGGTLDPFAEGVLVLGIGNSGTKRLAELLTSGKEYIADIALG
ncbi:MAG: tRNA pseudouridine(55) synthase, partial [bacterium]